MSGIRVLLAVLVALRPRLAETARLPRPTYQARTRPPCSGLYRQGAPQSISWLLAGRSQ